MQHQLKKVTYTTLKELKKQDIVLPSDYSKTFEKNAKELDIDLENQEIILKDLNYDAKLLDKIAKETNDNLYDLSTSAKNAQNAIIHKDNKMLEHIEDDVVKMQKKIEFLQAELFTDTLTKAKNRRWLNDVYLKNNLFTNNGTLAFVDLDNFKRINDNYGHILGDQVLKYLVTFFTRELRDDAHIVRYAGDEFLVIFNNEEYDIDFLNQRMQQVQIKISKQNLKSKHVSQLKFTFSYGLSRFTTDDNFDNIIEDADEEMYKNKSRNIK